jgi:HD-like signal output (HDOD) protein
VQGNEERRSYRHPSFEGLSEKDLVSLYNVTGVKKVNAGENLVSEGDSDSNIFLIVDGSLQLMKRRNGSADNVAVLGRGDSIPGASCFEYGVREMSAVASEALTAFVLDESRLSELPPQAQSTIYRNLNRRSARQTYDLLAAQADLLYKNKHLTSQIASFLQSRRDQHANSEMIHKLIKGIPRLPMYANRLAVVILDENVSSRDVAELAKLDPSLVSVVLKTVNSAFYGLKRKISDFQHAVLLLGLNQVYQLVMNVGIRSTMPRTPAFQELLFHSLIVSFIGFEIAQLCSQQKAVAVSTIGLLHDIGKSVVLLLKKQYPKMELLADMLDPATIGALLLKEWNIPETVCETLKYQSYPEWLPPDTIPEEYRKNVAVLFVAHLCYDYLAGKKESDLPTHLLDDYMGVLNRPEKSIGEFVEKKVYPPLDKKRKAFPEDIREFLAKSGESVLSGQRSPATP